MNEAEKERLIKKDIESIENRVRHAFNQGYEMGLKENKSEIPTGCEAAISREELIEALNTWDKFGYAPTNELIPLRGNADKDKYVPYIHYDDVLTCIRNMPSVSPQQRTGRWIKMDVGYKCSNCPLCTNLYGTQGYLYCPNCGAKMEVEE